MNPAKHLMLFWVDTGISPCPAMSSYYILWSSLIFFDILWSSLTNPIHLRFQTSHWRPLLQRQPMRTRKPLMLLETLIWECRAWDVPLFWSAYWDLIEVPFSGPSVVLTFIASLYIIVTLTYISIEIHCVCLKYFKKVFQTNKICPRHTWSKSKQVLIIPDLSFGKNLSTFRKTTERKATVIRDKWK